MLKLTRKKKQFKESEKGMALLETIPVLFMLVVVFNFSLGFFGAIHSGILNSIGSYNYAVETFRFRSNLMYFRPGGEGNANYAQSNNRVHGVTKDGSDNDTVEDKQRWPATVRAINFNYIKGRAGREITAAGQQSTFCDDNSCRTADESGPENIWKAKSESVPQLGTTIQTPRIWIKTVYGICLNADCKK